MVDPANTLLGRMLLDEITPVVMVLQTPLVEEACLGNGLSFVQMLSPFCSFSNIDVPVRTASDQPYRLQKFRLRLFNASDVRLPNWEASKERLKQVITQAGEKDLSELCSELPEITNELGRSESEIVPSWFQLFNKELMHTVSFSDHEAFDHPVACLLVVSSKDDDPISKFVDLFNTNKLPSLLSDGAMDPKILKHYLLVHDNRDNTSEKASKILSEMRSTFGSNECHLLSINSSQDGIDKHQINPWASSVSYSKESDGSSSQQLGCFLSNDDTMEIKDLMHNLSSKHLIPYMEQKIRMLNQQVSTTRRGFRNQIKNLWWRKGKEDTTESPDGSMYTFSSIESQIRVLGDYAFMLRDYELALSNYRLISTDYKLDKAWKRYAGVQEMMGLAYFMLDQSKKEAEYCMENAFTTYLKTGSSGQQNATRCGLWWVEMLKAGDQYKEAATVYFRVCGEEPLHSAVMLEQASYCYLLSKPPLLRKYGFHLVLSGDRYKRSDQIKHAIRTYRSAISVFKGTTWSHIKDHVHFHIGQWYASLGMYDFAVTQMLEVLACSHQSKATQELFLNDFLQTIQNTGKTIEVSKLQLPKINLSSLKVIFEDHRTYSSPAAACVRENLWRSLEEDMVPSLSSARTNWLELQSNLISKKYKESNICVAEEPVKVDIELKNPLQIPISISGVSLICELSAKSDAVKSDPNDSVEEPQNDGKIRGLANREMNSDSSLTLSEVDLSLAADETIIVQLTVTPMVEGILQILGVKWKFLGAVVGFHNFESNLLKKKISKGLHRTKKSRQDNLKFIVIKSLPKLEGFLHQLPKVAYAGDLRHLVLELRNHSEFSVKNLKMTISPPRFLCIGNQENLNTQFPACLVKRTTSENRVLRTNPNATFSFPENTSIQKGIPLLWPLWLRAAVPGDTSLYITIYYEIEDASSIIRYRTLRMHCNLQILPSLDVSFHIHPCPSRLQEFLVRMDVINRTNSEVFQTHQLSSVGNQWELSILQDVDTIFPSRALMAGQALSCFFMLKSVEKPSSSEEKTSSSSLSVGSDVIMLGLKGSSDEQFFDTSSFPIADFHHSERLHQEKSDQGDSNTVDLILISQPLKNETNTKISDPPHLFLHHACHCSTSSTGPISWAVEGPRTLYHDFSSNSFCEINLKMILQNPSDTTVSIRIVTSDKANSDVPPSSETAVQPGTSILSENQEGWHDISLTNDIKVTTELGSQIGKSLSLDGVYRFIWSGASSTKVQLKPLSKTEIPLQVCVFSPGICDLSNYTLHWDLLPSENEGNSKGMRQPAGTCRGYPYYLSVLQSS